MATLYGTLMQPICIAKDNGSLLGDAALLLPPVVKNHTPYVGTTVIFPIFTRSCALTLDWHRPQPLYPIPNMYRRA